MPRFGFRSAQILPRCWAMIERRLRMTSWRSEETFPAMARSTSESTSSSRASLRVVSSEGGATSASFYLAEVGGLDAHAFGYLADRVLGVVLS